MWHLSMIKLMGMDLLTKYVVNGCHKDKYDTVLSIHFIVGAISTLISNKMELLNYSIIKMRWCQSNEEFKNVKLHYYY